MPQDKGFSRRPKALDYVGAGGLDEDDAQRFAQEVVRELRPLSYHDPEGPAPDPEVVRERLEARQHSEG